MSEGLVTAKVKEQKGRENNEEKEGRETYRGGWKGIENPLFL